LYFGVILREHGFTDKQFLEYLGRSTLIELSCALNLPLYETTAMLQDIKSAEDTFISEKWTPSLLDFDVISPPLFGPAQGKNQLHAWREYAGASIRASSSVAKDRAKKNRRVLTNDDDWFNWRELSKRRGWEVKPGKAFYDDDQFEQYLKTFMELHNQRKQNDLDAYQRLLTDYIGVDTNGQLDYKNQNKTCLRQVLLGYLETYEVIAGENCLGCNRCVPDEKFYRYSMDERKSVVTRMDKATQELFDTLKAQSDSFPEDEQVEQLFNAIRADQQAGRSLKLYFVGWSAKLLDESPRHKTGMWLRLFAVIQNLMSVQKDEAVKYALYLFASLTQQELARFNSLLENLIQLVDDPELLFLRGQVFERMDDKQKEIEARRKYIDFAEQNNDKSLNRNKVYSSARRLLAILPKDDKELSFNEREPLHCLIGRCAPSYEESHTHYAEAVVKWTWEKVLEEKSKIEVLDESSERIAALFISWVNSGSERRWDSLITTVGEDLKILGGWPNKPLLQVLERLEEDKLITLNNLSDTYLKGGLQERKVISLAFKLFKNGIKLSTEARERIRQLLEMQDKSFGEELNNACKNEAEISMVIKELLSQSNTYSWSLFQGVFRLFSKNLLPPRDLDHLLLDNGINLLPNDGQDTGALFVLESFAQLIDIPEAWYLKCQLYEKMGDKQKEIEARRKYLKFDEQNKIFDREKIYSSVARLLAIFQQNDSKSSSNEKQYLHQLAGRCASTYEGSYAAYKELVRDWKWERLSEEREMIKIYNGVAYNAAAMVMAWLSFGHDERWDFVLSLVSKDPEILNGWPIEQHLSILERFSQEKLLSLPGVDLYIQHGPDERRVVGLAFECIKNGQSLSLAARLRIKQLLEMQDKSFGEELIPICQDEDQTRTLIRKLFLELGIDKRSLFLSLLRPFSKEFLPPRHIGYVLLDYCTNFLTKYRSSTMRKIHDLFEDLFGDPIFREKAAKSWMVVCLEDETALNDLLENLTDTPTDIEIANNFFDTYLESGLIKNLQHIPPQLPFQRWVKAAIFSKGILAYKAFQNMNGGNSFDKIEKEDLLFLKKQFVWQTDQDQADMLAVCLGEINKFQLRNWLTPIGLQVEVLVHAGRLAEARAIADSTRGLTLGPRRLDIESYIDNVKPKKSNQSISPDYQKILKRLMDHWANPEK